MSAPGELLVVVKYGAMRPTDRLKLEALGLIVVEVDDPAHVKLMRPSNEAEGGVLLRCAMAALAGGHFASEQREAFTKLLASEFKKGTP